MAGHYPLRTLEQLQEVRDELIFTADALFVAGVGPWEIYQSGKELYLSEQWQSVFGIEVSINQLREYLDQFEGDQTEFLEQIQKTFRHGVHATFKFHHKLAGQMVLSRGRVIEPGRMVGADLLL